MEKKSVVARIESREMEGILMSLLPIRSQRQLLNNGLNTKTNDDKLF